MHRIIALLFPLLCLGAAEDGVIMTDEVQRVADPANGDVPPQGPNMTWIFIAIFAFLIWTMISASRRQKREQNEKMAAIAALKIGDQCVTVGGVCGVVERIGEESVDLRTGGTDGAVMTFTKPAINQVVKEPAAANPS